MQSKDDDSLYLQIPLEEMKKLYERQISGIDTVKVNVRAVLSAASLIVSLVSAMQLVTVRIRPDWLGTYQAAVIAAVVLYLGLIIMCIVALWPVTVVGPMKADWDVLVNEFKEKSFREMLSVHLSSILNSIELNRPTLQRFKYLQMGAQILLGLLVTLILLMALIPRI